MTSQVPVDPSQSNVAIEISDNDCRNENLNEVPVSSVAAGSVFTTSSPWLYSL